MADFSEKLASELASLKPRMSIGVRSVRAEPFDVLTPGFVEAFSCRKKPFDRLRANGLINNPS
jgi:hypothetical protein